ncbi:MAG: hypothetical protein H7Z38_18995 [Rubrivivax sp.]|nr:hypothetical protein [Pyrinomonadaceae bacterium]
MSRKAAERTALAAEEILRGQTPHRRRQFAPHPYRLMQENGARGRVDPFIGAGSSLVPAYTTQLATILRRIFVGRRQVVMEWGAMRRDEIWAPGTRHRVMYAPEVDLAVGPFAALRGYVNAYDRMVARHAEMLEAMLRAFQKNLRSFGSSYSSPDLESLCSHNLNARCFMAVEIERGNAKMKYLIGSLTNAATLGRVGVVVAWDWVRMNDLLRAREYLAEMGAAGKNTLSTRNVLILGRNQALRVTTNFANVLLTPPPYRPATPSFSRSPRASRR